MAVAVCRADPGRDAHPARARPAPDADPGACDGCEPTVTNRASPVRLTLRLYTVEDGSVVFVRNPSTLDSIPLGWFARLDVVAKDADGRETNGNEEIRVALQ